MCLATKISRYTQGMLSMMKSLSPPSYMFCETWVPYRCHIRLLESFCIRRLLSILGLRWWHKMTRSEIRSRAGIPSIVSMLLHRQLRCLGHVFWMLDSSLPHRVHYGHQRLGHWIVGGQKRRFKDHIKSFLKKCSIPSNRLQVHASNRAACAFGMSRFDAEYDRFAAPRRSHRHHHAAVLFPIPDSVHQCQLCGRQCFSRISFQ